MFEAILIGIIQGLTEFLPISSSGHVIFLQQLTEYSNPGLIEAINLGSFLAVIIYFRQELITLLKTFFRRGASDLDRLESSPNFFASKKAGLMISSSVIPILAIGLTMEILNYSTESWKYVLILTGIASIFFGILFNISLSSKKKDKTEITWMDTILISVVQPIAALIPGASRSGVTLTTAYFRGIDKTLATKFVFLMSIPASGAGAIKGIFFNNQFDFNLEFLISSIFTFITSILAIKFLLNLLKSKSLKWILPYRILFGIACITLYFVKFA